MECKQENRLINQATWTQGEHSSLEGAAGYQEEVEKHQGGVRRRREIAQPAG